MIDAEALNQVWLRRPDIQAVYNPDGSAKNPKDPRIAGIPTLLDWANKFGVNEEPSLDPRNATLSQFFSPEEIKGMPDSVRTGLAGFIDVQNKNFDSGLKVDADITSKTWQDAMNAAAQDPDIVAKYGDEFKIASESINRGLQALEAGYTQEQAATMRKQEEERLAFEEAEAAAGRAYSGFRNEARNRLQLDQADVIKSSRRQLKETVQGFVGPFEERFGTDKLSNLNLPTIDEQSYTPFGEIKGNVEREKKSDIKSIAQDFFNAEQGAGL